MAGSKWRVGVIAATASQNWRANGPKPHIVRGFKVSRGPNFVAKLEEIVGPYTAPLEHALVLCYDEKNQARALDRTQPRLPLKKRRAATMMRDYAKWMDRLSLGARAIIVDGFGASRHPPIKA